jgi:putative hemolysin
LIDDPLPSLLAAVGFALLGSLFVGADTALTSLSPARIGALLEREGDPEKAALERIQRDPVRLRTHYVVGRAICTGLTFVFLYLTTTSTGASYPLLSATLAAALVLGVLFEVSATLARRYADYAAPLAARFLRPFEVILSPVSVPLGWLGSWLGSGGEIEPSSDPHVMEAEVEFMVDEGERMGLFDREPAELIRNVLEFAELAARNVMVPRPKVQVVEIDSTIAEVRALVAESGHSRYPVYKEQRDNVVGLLYAKDVFKVQEDDEAKIGPLVRTSVTYVPESQSLSTLLRQMRGQRQHMFVVVDEFGTMSGIVTLEDVLEEIVGDIQDEHDEAEKAPIEDLGDGRLVADADVSISDLSAYLGADIPEDEEYASLGGMLTHFTGRVPEIGTAIERFGLRFIVRDSDEKQVGKVEIVRHSGPTPPSTGAEAEVA